MRPTSIAVIAGLAVLNGGQALAEPKLDGEFRGRGEGRLTLQVFALDDPSPVAGAYFVSLQTALPNRCTGQVTGIARTSAPLTLTLRQKPDEDGDTCEVVLRYTSDGKGLRVDENACGNWHGRECAFEGKLTRVPPVP
ncbi:hypothetical protein [Methylobacterium iners]|uniref:Uncharacterized protein n=1 Tax=Methylobacterium iners TaxID=418707 RepID=A0ABQ4RS23_9HYPH|nr:hypothetical protein [Methylobacterium iners]GJD93145.1 hypothetical protein OCOJLMKI_0335 [Methylobacterium iners]